ncbi:peptide chain release factor N(5)-glutamine methyltransferase [Ruania halotolerans]|uniref:peptide chain release factor N(5)-glutamine methyltransferase n=1 Tax=Ruania halotolerans TaxID=2897773 RepID=UPI001E3B38E8|nr:peptide chain release factor N(5)-glutamine methyltransferase [Ruania halotolerans]UFU07646.1 peptide chain release factor N(5)-glutamine methyltransferase [Ruania halotolerans]
MTDPRGPAGSGTPADRSRGTADAEHAAWARLGLAADGQTHEPPSLNAIVRAGSALLEEAGVPSPDVDALRIAEHLLSAQRLTLVVPPRMPADFPRRFAEAIDRRRRREPLQHITGTAAFRYLELEVGPGVFVPRPETEVVAGVAIDAVQAAIAGGVARPVVVDLCSGSGAIACSVAHEVPAAEVYAVELGQQAASATEENAGRLGLTIDVQWSDATSPDVLDYLDGTVNVVVSNPPYIPPDAVPVDPEVRDHDPDLALYGGGADGLDVPRGVLARAVTLLRSGGTLVMEHAEVQAQALRELAEGTGTLEQVRTGQDLAGRDRMLIARKR